MFTAGGQEESHRRKSNNFLFVVCHVEKLNILKENLLKVQNIGHWDGASPFKMTILLVRQRRRTVKGFSLEMCKTGGGHIPGHLPPKVVVLILRIYLFGKTNIFFLFINCSSSHSK